MYRNHGKYITLSFWKTFEIPVLHSSAMLSVGDTMMCLLMLYTQYSISHLLNFDSLRTSHGKKIHSSGNKFSSPITPTFHCFVLVFFHVDLMLFCWFHLGFP